VSIGRHLFGRAGGPHLQVEVKVEAEDEEVKVEVEVEVQGEVEVKAEVEVEVKAEITGRPWSSGPWSTVGPSRSRRFRGRGAL
jgi:hypothetical protein